ncbi:MAG: hypothetical protein IJ715_03885 [Bacilli bacterium]|nr:hypothetical protein [Bacilli bacterium]
MKRIIKNPVMMYILGIITCTLTTVLASSLLASDITYKPKDPSWKVSNVSQALDELKTSVIKTRFCKLKSGNHLSIGSKYECNLGDDIKRDFYILSKDGKLIDMIMGSNLNVGVMDHSSAINFFSTGAGKNYINDWSNVLKIKLPTATQIANVVGITEILSKSANQVWCFENKANINVDPWCSDSEQLNQKYNWLKGYYWTDTVHNSGTAGWAVGEWPGLSGRPYSMGEKSSIRPVITVAEYNLYE